MIWLEHARSQAARFWSKVSAGGPDECWPWTAGTDKDGYGKFAVTLPPLGGRSPQKHVRAHRLAFLLVHGVAFGLVLHSCDNPPCCNPGHLRDGTQSQNVRDSVERGRFRGNAKLTPAQVAYVREMRGKRAARVLAAELGVCFSAVSHVWTGRNWQ